MSKLNNLIKVLSEDTDNPEEFRELFEKEITQRVQQRRSMREKARILAENSIRVYVLDGNDIHLRKSGGAWTAEHYGLDLSTEGKSIDEALEGILEKHRDKFIATYGSPSKWEQGFQRALNSKLSPFWKFLKPLKKQGLAFAAKNLEDVQKLREYYNENPINLTLTQVYVTIETDKDHIILRFIGEVDLNGVEVVIYRLDNEAEDKQAITCKIAGNDVRFALSALGLTIEELNQVAFRLKIGDKQVEGRL